MPKTTRTLRQKNAAYSSLPLLQNQQEFFVHVHRTGMAMSKFARSEKKKKKTLWIRMDVTKKKKFKGCLVSKKKEIKKEMKEGEKEKFFCNSKNQFFFSSFLPS